MSLNLLKGYSFGRNQYVDHNRKISDIREVHCRDLQGSVMGPPIFTGNLETFDNRKNSKHIENNINTEIKTITAWLKSNMLNSNVENMQMYDMF